MTTELGNFSPGAGALKTISHHSTSGETEVHRGQGMPEVTQPHLILILKDFQNPQSRSSELESSREGAGGPPYAPQLAQLLQQLS